MKWTITRAAPPVFPFEGHRHQGIVMADEAILRRQRRKILEGTRLRRRRMRARRAAA